MGASQRYIGLYDYTIIDSRAQSGQLVPTNPAPGAYKESPSVLGGGGRVGFGLFSLLLGSPEAPSVLSAILRT